MMISYALNFEDVMLMRALGRVEGGFYIDVGANHPTEYSVTKAFYDRGWRGVNVEPTPAPFALLAAERPRDVNLACALGTAPGSIRIWEPDVQGWATGRADIAAALAADGHKGVYHEVPLRTLAEICDQYAPRDIHFLKIDVEGLEKDVLAGGDFARHRPWVTVVEATYPNSRRETHEEWEMILLDAGYRLAYADGLNRFYVATERVELLDAFRYPPNVFDAFKPYAQQQAENAAAENAAVIHHHAEAARIAAEEARRLKEQAQVDADRAARAEELLKAALERASIADAAADNALRRIERAEELLAAAMARAADAETTANQALHRAEQAETDRRAAEKALQRVERTEELLAAALVRAAGAETDRRAAEEGRQAADAERRQAAAVAERLRAELQNLSETLGDTRAWAEWAEARAMTAEAELTAARGDVAALRASLSWRVTAPLRAVRALFRAGNPRDRAKMVRAALIRRLLRLVADPVRRARVAKLARRLGIVGPLRILHARLAAASSPPQACATDTAAINGPPVLDAMPPHTRELYARLDRAFNAAAGDDNAHRR